MTNFGHETGNLIEKMIKNISEALNIVLEQNYLPDVTSNSELEEADQNSPETLKDLSLEKGNVHEKIKNSFYNIWKLLLSTSNSTSYKVYSNYLKEDENQLFAFEKQFLETTFITGTPYSTDLEEVVTVVPG